MKSYLVRAPRSERADGPFTIEQLGELAKSELINPDTLYCEEGSEEFHPFSENPAIWKEISETGPSETEEPTSAEPEVPISNSEDHDSEPIKPKPLKLKKGNAPESREEAAPEPKPATAPELPPENFFVRAPDSENADGPFSLKQLRELADSGVLTSVTLYQKTGMDEFEPFSENSELWEKIKPEIKASLKLKSAVKAPVGKSAAPDESTEKPSSKPRKSKTEKKAPPPSPYDESSDINRMLAAAEGETEQTKHVQKLRKSRERAVTMILPCIVLSLLMSIAVIVQPFWETIFDMFKSGNYSLDFVFENWLVLFAVADLVLLLGIGLGQTSLFPFLRLRCAIGAGFFFFLFYSRQEWLAVGAMSLLQLSLIGATLCTRFATTCLFCVLSLAGGGAMIWLVWFKGIVY